MSDIQFTSIGEGVDVAYVPYTGDPTGSTVTGSLHLQMNTAGQSAALTSIQMELKIARALRDYLIAANLPPEPVSGV